MSFLRKITKTEPAQTASGSYEPSPFALKLATSPKTDFDGGNYPTPFVGENNRILVVCTEKHDLEMANGKKFSTGNHPVELALPMLHLLNAGFEVDIATPTGAPAALEMWAMPKSDKAVMQMFADYETAFKNPLSLQDITAKLSADNSPYIGIFIPGGHGAMIGLPEDESLGIILRHMQAQNLHIITLCHGPGALISAKEGNQFIFRGYETALFPDSVDKQTPMIGYLPGPMPFLLGERLENLGMTIINKKADDTVHIDRNLITGASPKAANNLGRLAAETMLKALR